MDVPYYLLLFLVKQQQYSQSVAYLLANSMQVPGEELANSVKAGKSYWKSHKERVWELLACSAVDDTGLATCTDESGAEVQAYAFELFEHDERVVDDMTSLYAIHEVGSCFTRFMYFDFMI